MSYENVDPMALAERLIVARKAANLTQESVASQLNISRPTFIAIEKGSRRPKPAELVLLAELYKEPLHRLLRDEARPQRLLPHLRSILEASGDGQQGLEEAIAVLGAFIEDYQYLEGLSNSRLHTNFPPPIRIAAGPVERFAEHCAQEERSRLNLGGHLPLHIPRKVLEKSGVHIFVEKLDSRLAGLYAFAPDFGYCILVNRLHPIERRRWTIAHEYGHFLTDRDQPGVDYLKPMMRKPQNEKFADAFAAAFLMPELGVQRRFYEEVDRTGDFNVGDLCRMADYFMVSVMAMSLRLESLSLIPRGSWDQIREERVQIKALKQEAGVEEGKDTDSVEPYPERYKLLAVHAFIDGKITEGQLAKLLRCSRIEARDVVEECSRTSDDGEGEGLIISLSLTHSLLTPSEVR